jgi:hypothetical protein
MQQDRSDHCTTIYRHGEIFFWYGHLWEVMAAKYSLGGQLLKCGFETEFEIQFTAGIIRETSCLTAMTTSQPNYHHKYTLLAALPGRQG